MKVEKAVKKEKRYAGILEKVTEPADFGSSNKVRIKLGDDWLTIIGSLDKINEKLSAVDIGDMVKAETIENRWTSQKTGKEHSDWWVQSLEKLEDGSEVQAIKEENIEEEVKEKAEEKKEETLDKEVQKISAGADIEDLQSKIETINNTLGVLSGSVGSILDAVNELSKLISDLDHRKQEQADSNHSEIFKLIKGLSK